MFRLIFLADVPFINSVLSETINGATTHCLKWSFIFQNLSHFLSLLEAVCTKITNPAFHLNRTFYSCLHRAEGQQKLINLYEASVQKTVIVSDLSFNTIIMMTLEFR